MVSRRSTLPWSATSVIDLLSTSITLFLWTYLSGTNAGFLLASKRGGGLLLAELNDNGSITRIMDDHVPITDREIKSMSYDPSGNNVLLELANPNELKYGKLCKNSDKALTPLFPENFLLKSEYVEQCYTNKLQTFAIFESRIYILIYCVRGYDMVAELLIFELQACDNCTKPKTNTNDTDIWYETLKCARFVTTAYRNESSRISSVSGLSLKPYRNEKQELMFYLQILIREYGANFITAETIMVSEKGYNETLFTTLAQERYGNETVHGFGRIDVNNSTVCWSVAGMVKCKTEGQVKDVVPTAQGYISQACKSAVSGNFQTLFITGVAIVKANPIRLIFGCYAQDNVTGGTGIVRSLDDIGPLMFNNELMSTGNVIYLDSLPDKCSEIEPVYCKIVPEDTTAKANVEKPNVSNGSNDNGPAKNDPVLGGASVNAHICLTLTVVLLLLLIGC